MQCVVGAHSSYSSTPQLKKRASSPLPFKKGEGEGVGEAPSEESSSLFPPPNVKYISSTSNPFLKHCVKLRQSSSYRHSHASALVVGSTPIREICQFDALNTERTNLLECLFLLDGAELPQGLGDALPLPLHTVAVSSAVMAKLSGVQSTRSIDAIALMRIPSTFVNLSNHQVAQDSARWFPCCRRILALEGIQDPGNLGTLLRSALALEWNGVFLLDGCCDPFNEKALRASRGASFHLPIVCGNWIHLDALRNKYQVKMLAGHPHCSDPSKPSFTLTQSLADSLSNTPLCLVLGSEGGGISEKTKKMCELVSIPMAAHFESLNVAVAGGIFMFMMQTERQG